MKVIKTRVETAKGSSEFFTGDAYVDRFKTVSETSNLMGGHVYFTPGARTKWHTHPHGQTLYVTNGVGLIGWRDHVEEIRAGDVVEIAPGEEHWHGATPQNFMSHIALNEVDENGTAASWDEAVSEADYTKLPKKS